MQSFGRVPDLKQTVVGAIGGSKVGSDFVELPQSMSGSPGVNERGEVSFLDHPFELQLTVNKFFTL